NRFYAAGEDIVAKVLGYDEAGDYWFAVGTNQETVLADGFAQGLVSYGGLLIYAGGTANWYTSSGLPDGAGDWTDQGVLGSLLSISMLKVAMYQGQLTLFAIGQNDGTGADTAVWMKVGSGAWTSVGSIQGQLYDVEVRLDADNVETIV